MNLLDSHGLDIDLRFYVRALLDWVQQPDIVDAMVQYGHATRGDLADLWAVLTCTKDEIGEKADTEWWLQYEDRIKQTLLAFAMNRNVRRLIAKRMEAIGVPKEQTMAGLLELKKALEPVAEA